ncbi:E1A [Bat mastadenovirus]|uniref:E1A n=1 Tax=Bat mastadenovirus TaxID=740971 RepID=A0A3G9E9S3_9ADEN|nr:E1A [Bat mastadenovirus]BBE29299.1 E1A [Bat mastadenovirus]
MKVFTVPPSFDLENYVQGLLDDWRPDCCLGEPCSRSPSPPSLYELFDLTPPASPVLPCVPAAPDSPPSSPVLCDDCYFEADEVLSPCCTEVSSTTEVLSTPSVSPIPTPVLDPTITEEMLLCLEEMPSFDDEDEVRSSSSSFEHWSGSLEPASGPSMGCLRCAFYQDRGEASLCGLCYLKALSEVPFSMPKRSGAAEEEVSSSESDVIFVGQSKRKSPCGFVSPAKRQKTDEPLPVQTEPLDLSIKPRPE